MMDEGPAGARQTLAPLIYPHICLGGGVCKGVASAERAHILDFFFPTMCDNGRDFLAPVGA